MKLSSLPFTLKISGLLLLLELSLISSILYIGIATHERHLNNDLKRDKELVSSLLETSLGPTLVTRDLAQAQLFLEQMQKEQKLLYLLLEDEQGRNIASVSINSEKPLPTIDMLPDLWLDDGVYDFASSIYLSDVIYGRIRVGINLSSYQELMVKWLNRSLLAASLIILISLGSFMWFGHYFSRPLNQLTRASKQLANGNLESRVNLKSQDELGQLTMAFNSMADRLAQQVNELKTSEQALDQERTFLQRIIDGVNDPILVLDLDLQVLLENRASQEKYGQRLNSRYCYNLIHGLDKPCSNQGINCPVELVKKTLKPQLLIHNIADSSGTQRTIEILGSPMLDANGKLTGVIESHRDITDRQTLELKLLEKNATILHLVNHDQLTGLANRILFNDRLEQSLKIIERSGGMIGVLMLDIDRFKTFNESLGQSQGDRLLIQIAERLKSATRSNDSVARVGSDEFAILLDPFKQLEGILNAINKLNALIGKPIMFNDQEYVFSASIGVAVAPVDSRQTLELTNCAEIALHRAKEHKAGGYIQFYTPELNQQIHEQLDMEILLRKAVTRNELRLHYQPVVDLANGDLLGFEALVRWQHPKKGLLSPDRFIPFAERTGHIFEIGQWVLLESCRQLKQWESAGANRLQISVNLSAQQFLDNSFVEKVEQVLQVTHIEPAKLELEITESMIMGDVDTAIQIMQKLSTLGVRLAIDDFGTGYSSLSYLKRFPISTLKIDRSFIQDIAQDPNDAIISASIVSLAHHMDLRVIAEGVENETQANILRDYQCDQAQGYLYAPPMPPGEALAFILGDTQPGALMS
ncbi:MAG: EAL domain-containing protein [Candidatus Thiodiazotropha lotti]|uniref:cyclic-guanylate-specific phosphodiesterase n=1 Tax=Candidatus Thiodiazotropha lotti TaxID=2792787 RepID=A0A9E4K7I2_9GAMM|nr:EAL domain-containing protein [Candidatus Thiodiazotropha lotti]MCW4205144.1 EAL domain-containing protein [Candidatus Thiodiazotropha lotti]